MKLSDQDTKLFYELMSALQYYVNSKLKTLPDIKSIKQYEDCTIEEKFKIRTALYKDKKLIDSFVKENPQNFSEEKLQIISKWKGFIEGDFFIERLLKKHAVFIKDTKVYGVIGLNQSFYEMHDPSHLPLLVKAVLLPFKGKVIYDGLIQIHNMSFGGGYKHELKEIYLRAKQRNLIIESFEPILKQAKTEKSSNANNKLQLDKLNGIVKKLHAASGSPAIFSPAFSLAKASIEFGQIAVTDPEDIENLYKSLKKVHRALNKVNTVLARESDW